MADDLISRRAALSKFEPWLKVPGYSEGERNMLKAVLYELRFLPSAQQWISVTERLPENDNDVLVTDGTDCAVAYWRTDAQAWDDSMHGWCDLYGLEVVAWMPLPEPWKGENDG